jgi:hypothetical protein
MKSPKQMALKFADDTASNKRDAGGNVFSLDVARQEKTRSTMRAVYESILESVRHVDLSRSSRHNR